MATNLITADVAAGDDILATHHNNMRDDIIKNAGDFEDTAGSSNAYTLAIDSGYSSYSDGDKFRFIASFSNTGAATLNVNSIGAKSLVRPDGSAMDSSEIISGQYYEAIYDSDLDDFILHKFYPLTTHIDATGSDSGSGSGIASGTLDSGTISIDLSPFDSGDKVEIRYILSLDVSCTENPGASASQVDIYDKTTEVDAGYAGVKISKLSGASLFNSLVTKAEPIGASADTAMSISLTAGTASCTGTVQPPTWNGNSIDFDWTLTGNLTTTDGANIVVNVKVFARRVI